ncbi:TPA: hypothetical protein N0F65_010085 [Lagenidium giganteum]|uniref:Secreted protein n=1 Tax=Lagenidium giganteum TaxID=4803 RepID=A0AAV2YJE7_9STRA|nr:TPA: hypothetical protein N0F65_010085 [Lagenidium giganteum]
MHLQFSCTFLPGITCGSTVVASYSNVQRLIMHSSRWDTTPEALSSRIRGDRLGATVLGRSRKEERV